MALASADMERLASCLSRLLPHLQRDRVALAGGIAVALELEERGLPGRRSRIADLDLVASELEAVKPGIVERFPVIHYHVPHAGYPKFLVMVVDPITRIRIDVFQDLAGSLARARPVGIVDLQWQALDAEAIFDHKLTLLERASAERPVDEKHYRDALALAPLLGRAVPEVADSCLGHDVYLTDLTVGCERCDKSRDPAFPLAPRQDIFDLLGYV